MEWSCEEWDDKKKKKKSEGCCGECEKRKEQGSLGWTVREQEQSKAGIAFSSFARSFFKKEIATRGKVKE